MRRTLIAAAILAQIGPLSAQAESYDPQTAGHPVRIAAYALHPVGVLLDRVIFRPAWYIGQREPMRTIFGVERRYDELVQEPAEAPTVD